MCLAISRFCDKFSLYSPALVRKRISFCSVCTLCCWTWPLICERSVVCFCAPWGVSRADRTRFVINHSDTGWQFHSFRFPKTPTAMNMRLTKRFLLVLLISGEEKGCVLDVDRVFCSAASGAFAAVRGSGSLLCFCVLFQALCFEKCPPSFSPGDYAVFAGGAYLSVPGSSSVNIAGVRVCAPLSFPLILHAWQAKPSRFPSGCGLTCCRRKCSCCKWARRRLATIK